MTISGIGNFCASFKAYCYTTQQASFALILKAKELRNDTDFFQKTFQVAFASLQLLMTQYPKLAVSLARFSFTLTTANMHDFFCFIKRPRGWIFPIHAQAIDEFIVLEDLTRILYKKSNHLNVDDHGSEKKIDKEKLNALRQFAQKYLNAQLKQMVTYDDAYCDLNEFVKALQNRLRKTENDAFDFSEIDLSDLNEKNSDYHLSQWMRHVSLIKRIENINWTIVDFSCAALYFQGWGFFDTAKWADRIGQYQGFQWVNKLQLANCVVGLVCTGYAWSILESVRQLSNEVLTAQQKRAARWNTIASLSELTLFGLIFSNMVGKTNIAAPYIHSLTIVSKMIGILRILNRPTPTFFQKP